MDRMTHILTIDLEDWYLAHLDHFRESPIALDAPTNPAIIPATRKMLEMLRATRNTATFFVSGTVARDFPSLTPEIRDAGHEIASHGYYHRRLDLLTPDQFRSDLARSLEVLSKTGVTEIRGFRAPCFSVTRKTLWALGIIREFGLAYDASIFPIRRRLYGIPSWPRHPLKLSNGLWEFPAATVNIAGQNLPVAGGGWFRMIPYSFIVRALRHSSLPQPAVLYLHPSEFYSAAAQMRHQPIGIYSNLVVGIENLGLRRSENKIRRLLSDFSFCRLDTRLPDNEATE